MSALRAAAATKHIRSLSQPLCRTFYSPFAALQQPSLTTAKSPSSATHNSGAAHEHEHEHSARKLHHVSEPSAADVKYGVPIGAYHVAVPFHPMTPAPGSGQMSAHENVSTGSISAVAMHPVLTRSVLRNTAGISASPAM